MLLSSVYLKVIAYIEKLMYNWQFLVDNEKEEIFSRTNLG